MIPLYTSGQIREFDRKLINDTGIPSIVLMENAAKNIFEICAEEFSLDSTADVIGIVCGKGNNGGDGFAAARHFLNAGFKVIVIAVYPHTEYTPDCFTNYSILTKSKEISENLQLIHYSSMQDFNKLRGCSLIIEALLGSGAKSQPDEFLTAIIKRLNQFRSRKAAIDIPAGLIADRGYVYRDEISEEAIVFKSDLTISLAAFKRGLFFNDGYLFTGRNLPADIGIYFREGEYPSEDFLVEPEDCFLSLPEKRTDIHKYTGGKLLIVAGSSAYPGAAVLAASAALKTGCGSVHLAVPESIYPQLAALLHNPEIVVHRIPDKSKGHFTAASAQQIIELTKKYNAVLCGPGISVNTDTAALIKALINGKVPLVLDADALTILGEMGDFDVSAKAIVTPHPGEFGRLTGKSVAQLRENILDIGKEFSEGNNILTVYKDFRTIIFTPQGESLINPTGNPGLAKIGSGDVLAGLIAGYFAQHGSREKAAVAAVYLHGLSADILTKERTELAYSASELIASFHNAVNLVKGSVDI